MRKNSDLISIVVPCYNVEKYVQRCIESIKEQTYTNLEILMIDDGSKDNTKKIVKEKIKEDKRFCYYYKKNGGLSDARNFGLQKATGKYVCFIDSDDYIEKSFIEKLYSAIKREKSQIAICDINRVYENKTKADGINEFMVETCMKPAACNKMFLRELFVKENILFPVGKWYEDLGTTPKLTLKYKWSVVKEPLYNYIQNSSSIMHTYDDRIFEIYEIIENLENYAKEKKIKKDVLEFINIYHILIGTIYRSSFHKNFKKMMVKNITEYVSNKYPEWYKNKYMESLPYFYKCYLKFLKWHMYSLIYWMLKISGDKIHL